MPAEVKRLDVKVAALMTKFDEIKECCRKLRIGKKGSKRKSSS